MLTKIVMNSFTRQASHFLRPVRPFKANSVRCVSYDRWGVHFPLSWTAINPFDSAGSLTSDATRSWLSYVSAAADVPLLGLTLGQLLQRAADSYGDQTSAVFLHQNIRKSFHQLLHDVRYHLTDLYQKKKEKKKKSWLNLLHASQIGGSSGCVVPVVGLETGGSVRHLGPQFLRMVRDPMGRSSRWTHSRKWTNLSTSKPSGRVAENKWKNVLHFRWISILHTKPTNCATPWIWSKSKLSSWRTRSAIKTWLKSWPNWFLRPIPTVETSSSALHCRTWNASSSCRTTPLFPSNNLRLQTIFFSYQVDISTAAPWDGPIYCKEPLLLWSAKCTTCSVVSSLTNPSTSNSHRLITYFIHSKGRI